jgi:serine/threonine protein kinase
MPEGDNAPMIVTEWMSNGSLEDLLKNPAKYAKLTGTQKAKIIVGICKGMKYIHECGGMHRDLKPSNILLDKNFEIRITDFGSSKFSSPTESIIKTRGLGTPLYMAPEAIEDKYDGAVDVFSFAMMLWEIATGKSLVDLYKAQCQNSVKWFQLVTAGTRPATEGINASVQGILDCCWETDPDNRMGWNDILDFLQKNHYDIFEGVDPAAVVAYLNRIELFEGEFPAMPDESD